MILATIGWVVLDSLWQWTLVAGAAAMALALAGESRPRARYAIASLALATMLALSAVTAIAANRLDAPRHAALYAFDSVLMIPAVAPIGYLILRAAAIAWLAGVLIGLLRIAFEWRRARALSHGPLRPPGATVEGIVAAACARMAVGRAVTVRCSTRASVPMLLGWRRPLILLPPGSVTRLSTGQLAAVIAHELDHVRRGDYPANLLQLAADAIAFHHPAARWVSRRIRTEREYCCDDAAVAMTRDAADYARALAALEDARSPSTFAVAAASGTLLDRIQRVVGAPRPVLTRARAACALVVAIALSGVLLAISVNVPPPWVPPGVRMRRPGPPPAASQGATSPGAATSPGGTVPRGDGRNLDRETSRIPADSR
jgi:beta-lactamase regulating signal transducer with metallopeptidase domain